MRLAGADKGYNRVCPHLGVKLPVLGRQQHAILALADQQVFRNEVTAGNGLKVSRAASSLQISSRQARQQQILTTGETRRCQVAE